VNINLAPGNQRPIKKIVSSQMSFFAQRAAYTLVCLCLITLIATTHAHGCKGNISVAELTALEAFYNETSPAWWNLTSCNSLGNRWSFPASLSAPCNDNWVGINCTRSSGMGPNYCAVQYLELNYCNVSGKLTNSISELSALQLLELHTNDLKGTLPSQVGLLTNLVRLDVGSNLFTYTIPPEIGALTKLTYLYLYHNKFTGYIPDSIWNLTKLTTLQIGDSSLQGSLPDAFTSLVNLGYVKIAYTMMTGPFPTGICAMTKIGSLIIENNLMSGPVPDFSAMSKLSVLYINSNSLSGELPSNFPSSLTYTFLYNNELKGTLVDSLFQSKLVEILTYGNSFTGPVPSTFGSATKMTSINIGKNSMTGAIPSTLGNLKSLVFCVFSTNSFSGQLPTVLSGLTALEQFQISNTFITGSIPTELGLLSSLANLYLTNAFLTGPVPPELGTSKSLGTLALAQNYLSSTLPAAAIRNISTLQAINVTQNMLNGPVEAIFSNSTVDGETVPMLTKLVSIDFSFNAFTGTVPAVMFTSLPLLQSVSLLLNCFHGTLTEQICDATSLQVLIMDNINGATACSLYIPPALRPIVRGSITNGYNYGALPSCILQMPSLTTLHLSGLGLSGTLGDIADDSSLVDLVLDSNYLSGTIPKSIQQYGKFVQLGLGSNEFRGSLQNDFAVYANATMLDLSVNRLSGPIPDTFVDAPVVNALNGNLFGCGNLPENDPNTADYVCGSSSLNASIFAWVAVLLTTVGAGGGIAYLYTKRKNEKNASTESDPTTSKMSIVEHVDNPMNKGALEARPCSNGSIAPKENIPLPKICSGEYFVDCVDQTRSWWNTRVVAKRSFATCMLLYILKAAAFVTSILALLYFVVLMTAYPTMKQGGKEGIYLVRTHAFQYGWAYTAAYMHGVTPTVLIIVMLVVTSVIIIVFLFGVGRQLIKVSDYFAPKTQVLIPAFNLDGPKTESALPDFGCAVRTPLDPEAGIACEGQEATRDDTTVTPVTNGSNDTIPKKTDGSKRVQFEIGHDDASDPDHDSIYRNRASIFNLFGENLKPTAAKRSSSMDKISKQMTSRWVSGGTTEGKHLRLKAFCMHIINGTVTLVLNAGYIAILLSGSVSPEVLSLIQLILGVIKVGWKSMVVPAVVSSLLDGMNKSDQIFHQVFIDEFNFIASPVIATLLTDSSCFLNVFVPMASVASEYQVESSINENCTPITLANGGSSLSCVATFQLETVQQSVEPPWVYSYQCSSSIFTNYIPVLMYSFTFSGIVMPAIQFILMFARDATIKKIVPEKYQSIFVNKLPWPTFQKPYTEEELTKGKESPKIFNLGALISTIILELTVLITFGMASPVLGVCVAVCLVSLSIQWRLMIGRYVLVAPLTRQEVFKRMEDATTGLCSGLFGCLSTLVLMTSMFWGVICFDYIADNNGINNGIIATICIFVIVPLPFWAIFYIPQLASQYQTASDMAADAPHTFGQIGRQMSSSVSDMKFNFTQALDQGANGTRGGNGALSGHDPTAVPDDNSNFSGQDPDDASNGNGNGNGDDNGSKLSPGTPTDDPSIFFRDSFFLPKWTDKF
jgi:Leucine-rich repeat (LRR) protein